MEHAKGYGHEEVCQVDGVNNFLSAQAYPKTGEA